MDKKDKIIEKNDALIQKMEERDAVYAQILQKRQKAEIPEEELQKVKETIKNTKCDLPDTTEMVKKIATGVTGGIRSVLSDEIREAVRNEYMPSGCVETLKAKLMVYRVICVWMVLMCMGTSLCYSNGEHYWGSQYLKVAESKYLTDDEKKALWKDIYAVDALPKEFKSNPAYVKSKIKQNKSVLKERKKESKAHKGKWSAKVPIER